MKILFKSQDLGNLVENCYNEVSDVEAFDVLLRKEKDSSVEFRKKD